MLRLLMRIGCDLEMPNEHGISPMLIAIKERHKDCVQSLYRLGADTGVVSRIGFLIFKSREVLPGTVTDGVFITEVLREVRRTCEVCHMRSPKPFGCCARCERAHYCSKECQKKVHRKHKKECVKHHHFFL